jgi:hypothetical protein
MRQDRGSFTDNHPICVGPGAASGWRVSCVVLGRVGRGSWLEHVCVFLCLGLGILGSLAVFASVWLCSGQCCLHSMCGCAAVSEG